MKWPYKVRPRKNGPVLAKIYRPCSGRDSYRVVWKAGGKRMMKSLSRFAGKDGANEFAKQKVKELAEGSQVPILTAAEARNALAVRKALIWCIKTQIPEIRVLRSGRTVGLRRPHRNNQPGPSGPAVRIARQNRQRCGFRSAVAGGPQGGARLPAPRSGTHARPLGGA